MTYTGRTEPYRTVRTTVRRTIYRGLCTARVPTAVPCLNFRIRMCRIWSYKTINIVRNRPNFDQFKTELRDFGADEVYTEEEVLAEGRLSGLA